MQILRLIILPNHHEALTARPKVPFPLVSLSDLTRASATRTVRNPSFIRDISRPAHPRCAVELNHSDSVVMVGLVAGQIAAGQFRSINHTQLPGRTTLGPGQTTSGPAIGLQNKGRRVLGKGLAHKTPAPRQSWEALVGTIRDRWGRGNRGRRWSTLSSRRRLAETVTADVRPNKNWGGQGRRGRDGPGAADPRYHGWSVEHVARSLSHGWSTR